MNRRSFLLTATTLAATVAARAVPHPPPPRRRPVATVLFFTPHQDDETLSMGTAIRDHLDAGHDVHTVLMTTGQNSGVRTQLGMTVTDFVAARDDEYLRATRQVGVRTCNAHIAAARTQDGQLTVACAQAIMNTYLYTYPGAWIKTYSDLPCTGRHPDHVAAGQAARTMGVINTRYYVEPWLLSTFRATNPSVPVGIESITDASSVLLGYAEYQRRDAIAGMYGIGYRSVGQDFTANDNPPQSYYHV